MNAFIYLSKFLAYLFLKHCNFEAGESDIFLSDIGAVKPPDFGYNKDNTSIDAIDDSSTHKVGVEHCFKDEVTVKNNPVNEVTAFEEPGETELGNFFMEGDSSNAALPPEVLMFQNKAKARVLPTSKDLEKLEGIWKKVICRLH